MSTSNVAAASTAGTTTTPANKETTTAKVFVGNLSFKTKTAELAAAFSVAGHVVSANIITRGPRSLGYGFVELESEEDAQKAVSIMHKKEIDGREINVEVAKPRDDAAPNAPGAQGGNQQGGAPAAKPQQGDSQDNGQAPRSPGQRGGRGRGLPRRRRGFSGGYNQGGYQNQGGNFQTQGSYNQGQVSQGGFRGSRGGYGGGRGGGFRGGRGGQGGRNAGNWQQGAPNQGGAPRQQSNNFNQQQGGNQANQAPRDPSPTTLFVANIPFTVNDLQLAETFKDFNVVKAHVVLKRNGRSKGFGFVELKSTEDQQKALAAFEKKEMGGRELIVKVALAEPAQNQGDLHSATAGGQETKQDAKP